MPESAPRLEYLPATGFAQADLVLLHGWGGGGSVWRPVLAGLRAWANVSLIDWQPARGPVEVALATLIDEILRLAPYRAVYVGWSLGGQLAAALAHAAPQRVAAVMTVASNPHFVAGSDWPGMPAAQFEAFEVLAATAPVPALKKFDTLQALGAEDERNLSRELSRLGGNWPGSALCAGLAWLAALDTRTLLRQLAVPQLHLLATGDALLPGSLAPALESLLANTPEAVVRTLESGGHALPLTAAPALARALAELALVDAPAAVIAAPPDPVAKRDIAASFSRSAAQYDSVAALQRDVGERLLTRLGLERLDPAILLDLGCGTGYFQPALQASYPGAQYLGMDLAAGMLDYARAHHPGPSIWAQGDAESLPLEASSTGLVFSSLAFQWCYRPDLLFAELARVLQPGAVCLFATLGPATLHELRRAWAAVDTAQHVNTFLPVDVLHAAADRIPSVQLQLHSEPVVMRYQKVGDLLGELKTLGAHNMNSARSEGLTGRSRLAAMIRAYEECREDEGLPATYEVIFGRLEKS